MVARAPPTSTSRWGRRPRSASAASSSASTALSALTPEDTQQLLYRILSTEQQKQLEIKRQIDTLALDPGPRPLPRQRLLPARGARRRLPRHPGGAEDARGARPAALARRAGDAAARPRPRHRPDRLRQVDDARGDDRRGQPQPHRSHPHDRGPDRVRAPPQALHRQPARDRRRRRPASARRSAPRSARTPT